MTNEQHEKAIDFVNKLGPHTRSLIMIEINHDGNCQIYLEGTLQDWIFQKEMLTNFIQNQLNVINTQPFLEKIIHRK